MSASFESPYRTQHWQLTKPVAAGRGGIVVAQNREAAEAGASVHPQKISSQKFWSGASVRVILSLVIIIVSALRGRATSD